MEVKISFKDGDKSSSFKFEGDIKEVFDKAQRAFEAALKLVSSEN